MTAINVKRLAVFLFLLAGLSAVSEAKDVWLSSRTVTADSLKPLCAQGQKGIFHGVCINTAVASSSMSVVNSSYTMTGTQTFGNRSTAVSSNCSYYDILATKGLLYDKFGIADVTILYQCY